MLGLAVWLAAVSAAAAHPLGNFSINHLTEVTISADRVDLRYILDQAEIPTFQERDVAPAVVLARKRAEVLRALKLTADGRQLELRPRPGVSITFPPGQGGLSLTRVVLPLSATVRLPARLTLHDGTFPDRVGWKAIVARPGRATAVRSDVPSGDPTHGLRKYPANLLMSPLDERSAAFTAKRGAGTLLAPRARGEGATTTNRAGDGLAGAFERASAGEGVLVLLLLAAFGWGAVHALSPGHGKAMVAAYLVGARGTARHAVALGATVTITHTIGVFALGLVTLLLSQYILPEDLYPWLNLASGLLVLAVGAAVLRTRIRATRRQRAVPANCQLPTANSTHHHPHKHHHHHTPPQTITWRSLLAMGASAGLIPCPSALVVLLGAVAQHQVALGLLLIVAFSLGLATTLTGLGLAVVGAGRLTARIDVSGRAVAVLPAVSALIIVGAGFVLTAQALTRVT
jgi:ABC-type nickel/cobalt efflux system permease component RcnA